MKKIIRLLSIISLILLSGCSSSLPEFKKTDVINCTSGDYSIPETIENALDTFDAKADHIRISRVNTTSQEYTCSVDIIFDEPIQDGFIETKALEFMHCEFWIDGMNEVRKVGHTNEEIVDLYCEY